MYQQMGCLLLNVHPASIVVSASASSHDACGGPNLQRSLGHVALLHTLPLIFGINLGWLLSSRAGKVHVFFCCMRLARPEQAEVLLLRLVSALAMMHMHDVVCMEHMKPAYKHTV